MTDTHELEATLEAWDDLALDHESKLSDLDDLIEKIKTQSQRLKDAEVFPSIDPKEELRKLLDLVDDLPDDLWGTFRDALPE